VPERKPERKSFLCAYTPPHRRCFRIRITGSEQQLRLVRSQCFRGFVACRPPFKAAFGKTLRGNPEALTVIGEDSDRLAAAAAEDEQAAGKRVGIEFLTAELRQGIDPLSSVDRFNRNQDAQLRCDLDQAADSNKSRLSVARYEAEAPFNRIRSFPWRPSSSMVHSGTGWGAATSSTNAGAARFSDLCEAPAMRRFK
jgi:hypothetical protein